MALSRKTKNLLGVSAATTVLALAGLFNQGTTPAEAQAQPEAQDGPEPHITAVSSYEEFWEKNKYAPLKNPESAPYRAALVERFANNNHTGNPSVGDLCTAHSLALLQEKLAEVYPDKETISAEESLYLTTQIMMLCARGEKPSIS